MTAKNENKPVRVSRWYFGGLATAAAASCTHPLDLLKVHLQTQTDKSLGLYQMGKRVVVNEGVLSLYNGLSASLVRQLTYSTTRFAIYETVKNQWLQKDNQSPMPFYQKVLLGGFSGAIGGVVGTPADMVNVRMQNDMKIPKEQRRNYKHAFDGFAKVARHEGPRTLMNGASMASLRATFVTIGQLSMYDQFKQLLLATGIFRDNVITHFTASFAAGTVATLITMPVDVSKTRLMNAAPGTYKSLAHCFKDIALTSGPSGFFKGFLPAFVRLGPQTVLTFMFLEQMRLNFGYVKNSK